jgi:hypothetical protein
LRTTEGGKYNQMRSAYSHTTPREKVGILFTWSHGLTMPQIADVFRRSPSTVWNVVKAAYDLIGRKRVDNRRKPRQLRDHLARAARWSVQVRSWRAALFASGWLSSAEEILLGRPEQPDGEEDEPP